MLVPMGLSLLPWVLVLLGLSPLWLFPRQGSLYPGVLFLLAALLLAATASLYARTSLGPRLRLLWVLGLSSMGTLMALLAAQDLAQAPEGVAVAAAGVGLLGTSLFLLGLFFLGQEALLLLPRPASSGVLPGGALQGLAPSLEALAAVRPVTLLLLHTSPEQPGDELLRLLRQPDMVFELKPGQFLLVLQGSGPEGAQSAFRRIRQSLAIRAYAVLPLKGVSLQQALRQLEGELQHYYLTQH
ncbi:diguanylate cyclase [Meiothermus sp. QL-1]|uniref:diguanylate cyclase n=1 Tax=Meiothermus sp. QL-1 TaxID=2058095 RepID=UPI000E0C6170|nr:diguanylate cyclase [Meiothermus sp. QL-1]RDI96028.1 diguanylate cyclase [Meiothermus sp. QL-1]